MAMTCTVCNGVLHKRREKSDDEDVRDSEIAVRGLGSDRLDDRSANCPKCGRMTHNKRLVKRFLKRGG